MNRLSRARIAQSYRSVVTIFDSGQETMGSPPFFMRAMSLFTAILCRDRPTPGICCILDKAELELRDNFREDRDAIRLPLAFLA
jgi:hypothetical protein